MGLPSEDAVVFAGSDRGGARAAAMYTLIGTAKLNDVDPQASGSPVFSHASSGRRRTGLNELLPWNWPLVLQHGLAP